MKSYLCQTTELKLGYVIVNQVAVRRYALENQMSGL